MQAHSSLAEGNFPRRMWHQIDNRKKRTAGSNLGYHSPIGIQRLLMPRLCGGTQVELA